MVDTVVPNNPYVGPRSIKTGEAFFGRDREIRSLSALLIAERIVLLHSPSGAGKSSLIQAGLIPRMSERFSVLPLIRVNLEAPEEVRGAAGLNRYLMSTLLSLEEGLPPEKRLPLVELATLSLDAYLEKRALPDEAPENCLLLFDQFEEVLTVSPTDAPAKQAFFEQLGDALQNRRRWALFAIREDYMGGLAPYVRAIPNRLNVPFRLGLLGPEAARVAIQQPAKNKDVDFTDEAAQKLVDDLRRIQVQQPDGSFITEAGPNVEPVQLQVVCFNLWQSHAADDKIIDENDLQRVGSVDQALASYYANAVRSVAESAKVDERILRQWFDEHLITPEGIRSQVLKGAEASEGLPNIVLRLLENTHLVRGETRAGKTWYELSHDRLVQPVRQDNNAWFEHNLSLLQRQSVLWNQQGRSEGLLLRGKELVDAEQESNSLRLTPDETAFLEASQKLQKREQRDRRQRQFILIGLVASLIFLALSIAGFFRASQQTQAAQAEKVRANQNAAEAQTAQANAVSETNVRATAQANAEIEKQNAEKQRQIAEDQVKAARAGEFSLQANAVREKEADLAMLLGIEAFRLKDNSRTRAALLDNVQYEPQLQRYLFGHSNSVTSVAISPNGKIIASASFKIIPVSDRYPPPTFGEIILWDADTGKPIGQPLIGHRSAITSLAFSPDGNLLASSAADRSIILWDTSTRKPVGQPLESKALIYAIAFDPTGKLLASGNESDSSAGKITLWDVQTGKPLDITFTGEHTVGEIAFNPDGKTIASASWDNTIILWDAQTGKPIGQPFIGHADSYSVSNIAFNPDGKTIASSSDSEIILWNIETHQPIKKLTAGVIDIAFTPDGKTLVSANGDITLWDTTTYQPIGEPWAAGNSRCIAISPDGKILVSGNEDGTVTLWNMQTTFPIGKSLTGDLENISNVNVVSPDGKTLALVQQDSKAILLWNIAEQHPIGQLLPDYDIYIMAFSPDGKMLATNGSDVISIVIWDLKTGEPVGQPLVDGWRITSMAFSPDSKQLASTSEYVRLWSVETHEIIKEISGYQHSPFGKYEKPRQTILALGNEISSGYFAISEILILLQQDMFWKKIVASDIFPNTVGKPPAGGHTPEYGGIIFNADGNLIAFTNSITGTYSVCIWNSQTDRITELPNDFGFVSDMVFSPDGKTLVTAGNQIVFWDAQSGKPVGLPILGNFNGFSNPALSPDGSLLAATAGESIMLWDIRSRLPIGQPIPGYKGWGTELMFNPTDSGKSIIFTGCAQDYAHGAVILWELDPQTWIAKACERVGRNFTYTEWEQLFPETDYRRTCENWSVHPTVAREIIEQTFSNGAITQKAKTALDKVAELLKGDTTVQDPSSESKRLVSNFVQEKLIQMPLAGSRAIDAETIKSMIAVMNGVDYLGLSVDSLLFYRVCWDGSRNGYAQDVLHFCERAVRLEPDTPTYWHGRGIARALTGDFTGASLDFQIFIDERIKVEGQSDTVKQHQQWIQDLKAGKNPFTPEVLKMLTWPW